MFDAGVKETLCTRCAHREVCIYKQDYLDIIKAVENAAITRDTPDGKITSKKVIHYDFISGISVNYFLAVNDRQLGTCLRMLFAEKLQPAVQTVLNEKGKIEFHISIAADQEVFEELNERYKIMIS